jgi:hypothetical protein
MKPNTSKVASPQPLSLRRGAKTLDSIEFQRLYKFILCSNGILNRLDLDASIASFTNPYKSEIRHQKSKNLPYGVCPGSVSVKTLSSHLFFLLLK